MSCVYNGVAIGQDVVKQYYLITSMLESFFNHIAICLIFYVLWSLIHGFLDGLTDVGRPFAAVNIIHWIFLGILWALGLACFALDVVNTTYYVTQASALRIEVASEKVYTANAILCFVASLEVLSWSIFVTVRGGSDRFRSRVGNGFPFYGSRGY
jgi:hypothetical protein